MVVGAVTSDSVSFNRVGTQGQRHGGSVVEYVVAVTQFAFLFCDTVKSGLYLLFFKLLLRAASRAEVKSVAG